MQATIATITKCQQEAGVTEVSLLNFVVSDGINMIATRYVSHDSESPASLYYAEGSAFQRELQETGARPESATPGAASNAASARNTAVTGQLRHMLLSLLLFVLWQPQLPGQLLSSQCIFVFARQHPISDCNCELPVDCYMMG